MKGLFNIRDCFGAFVACFRMATVKELVEKRMNTMALKLHIKCHVEFQAKRVMALFPVYKLVDNICVRNLYLYTGKKATTQLARFHTLEFASGASLSRGLHEVTHISKFNADNDFVQAMSNRRHH